MGGRTSDDTGAGDRLCPGGGCYRDVNNSVATLPQGVCGGINHNAINLREGERLEIMVTLTIAAQHCIAHIAGEATSPLRSMPAMRLRITPSGHVDCTPLTGPG